MFQATQDAATTEHQPTVQSNAAAKRSKDEAEATKGRLIDQRFEMTKYADPLAPRQGSPSQYLPQGVTEEMERKWLATIAASRNPSG